MELHQLRYFVQIAEAGSFTRAAEELSLAQPSLSQQIRKLEHELGFPLFDRSPARVVLTSEGALFLGHARAVLQRVSEAMTAAGEIRGVQRGQVTIGISPIVGERILPRLLTAIRKEFPNLRITTREAGLGRLMGSLETGEVDLALLHVPPADPELAFTTILEEKLMAVLPRGHAHAGERPLDLAKLAGEPFLVLTREFGLRQRIEDECARAGFTPQIAFESSEVGILQGLAAEGLGVTVLPESAIRPDLPTVVVPLSVAGETPRRSIGLGYRRDRYLSVAARAVFELAKRLY